MPTGSSRRDPRIWARRLTACRFTSSRAPRAMPSDTAASGGARTTNSGRRQSGPSGHGWSANEQVCLRSTSMSVTDVSLTRRGPQASDVPGGVDRHLGSRHEHQAGCGLARKAGGQTDPGRLLAVAGERPAPGETNGAVRRVGRLRRRGEHRRVRPVGVGEHLGRAVRRKVPGEVARPEPDRRRPGGAAVRGGELLDDLDRAPGRYGAAAQLGWQQEPVDAGGGQRGDHLGVEVAGLVGRRRSVGDQGDDVAAELDVEGERGRHGCAFRLLRFT